MTDRWKYVHRATPGVIHAASHKDPKRASAVIMFCGIVGVPLTMERGVTVHGCAKCIERGAPR